jgi:hypothetical protein
MKSLLAAAAASAFSFSAIVLQSFLLVQTISASLLRETVAVCANSPFAVIQVVIAMDTIAIARADGYPLVSLGGDSDQKVAALMPVKCIAATPVVATTEKRNWRLR